MKLVLILAALALPTFAFAHINALDIEEQSFQAQELCENCGGAGVDYFGELSREFDGGREALPVQVMGWTVGRCYRTGARTTPLAAVLAGQEVIVGGNNGPMFPAKRVLKINSVINESSEAFFDDLARNAEKSKMLSDFLATDLNRLMPACSRDGSLVGASELGDYHVRLTADGKYLVLKAIATKAVDSRRIGDVIGMCYFYNKVR